MTYFDINNIPDKLKEYIYLEISNVIDKKLYKTKKPHLALITRDEKLLDNIFSKDKCLFHVGDGKFFTYITEKTKIDYASEFFTQCIIKGAIEDTDEWGSKECSKYIKKYGIEKIYNDIVNDYKETIILKGE